MDLGKMAGKPIQMTIGEQKYTLSPVTIGDLADFEQYIKEERLDRFLKVARQRKMGQPIILEMTTRILVRPFSNEDFSVELATMTGIRFLIWRSISKNHPKFTMADASKIEDMDEVVEVINSISGLGRVNPENPLEPTGQEDEPSGINSSA